ncbi:guanylin family protein [Gambusia affinis]|uniref:guanylin family protein n=1 Tax=Gambusia affinis TaxID=33528 RepID=UPI001CDC4026|nr:guanylin family protein [Gambusia affinis]
MMMESLSLNGLWSHDCLTPGFEHLKGSLRKEKNQTHLAEHLLRTTHRSKKLQNNLLPTTTMKTTFAAVALLVLALGLTSEAVEVEENGLMFSLEAVKRLQELSESRAMTGQLNPRFKASPISLCAEPMLPQELLPLCKQTGGSSSLVRLAAVPMDVCEICAFAACTGC